MAERYRTRGAAAPGCLHWAPADGADGYRRPIKKSRYKTIHHTRWRERGGAPPLLHSTIIPVSFFFFLLQLLPVLPSFSILFVIAKPIHPPDGLFLPALQTQHKNLERRHILQSLFYRQIKWQSVVCARRRARE